MILARPTTNSAVPRGDETAPSLRRSGPPASDRASSSGSIIAPRDGNDAVAAAQTRLLRLAVERPGPGVVVVRMRGEIDLSSVPRLTELIRQRLTAAVLRALVLDLSEVSFCNSYGLELMLQTQRRAEYRCIEMYLVPGPSPIPQLLRLTGLAEWFTSRDTVAAAVDELHD